jgi:hypothetical protein
VHRPIHVPLLLSPAGCGQHYREHREFHSHTYCLLWQIPRTCAGTPARRVIIGIFVKESDSPQPAARNDESEPMLYCPVCSTRLTERKCKLLCEKCGYYLSCADYY